MWFPVDEPWQYRVLDGLPRSHDPAQLDAALRMTPTERIEAMIRLLELVEAIRTPVPAGGPEGER